MNIEKYLNEPEEKRKNSIKSVTQKKFDKFIKALKNTTDGILSDDDFIYKKRNDINTNELTDIWNYLEFTYLKNNFELNSYDFSDMFPDMRSFFEYNNFKFIMRLLVGQGSSRQFIFKFSKSWPKNKPMKFYENKKIIIRF